MEAIRRNLPNIVGASPPLYTSEVGGDTPATTLFAMIVAWSDTAPGFSDQYPAEMTWSFMTELRPYRCMWTNEIR